MSIKKNLLLVSIVLAALALVIPTLASAVEIKDKGKAITEVPVSASGEVGFETLGSGIECAVHVNATLTPTVVHITKFEVTIATCKDKGEYNACEVVTAEATLPWTFEVKSEGLVAPAAALDTTLKSKKGKTCFFTTTTLTLKGMTWYYVKKFEPRETGSPFVIWEWKNAVKVDDNFKEMTTAGVGDLELLGSAKGTYEVS